MPYSNCPTGDELLALSVGKLPEERSEVIFEHLEYCTACQETLETMPEPEDTLLQALRSPLQHDPYLDEPECQRALAAVLDMSPGGS